MEIPDPRSDIQTLVLLFGYLRLRASSMRSGTRRKRDTRQTGHDENGTRRTPKIVQKSIKNCPKNCPKIIPNWSWWPSLGCLEPSWRQVGPSWRQVGPSWPQDPPKWEPCWRMLDPYWPILAPCWPILTPCWPILAPSWPQDPQHVAKMIPG